MEPPPSVNESNKQEIYNFQGNTTQSKIIITITSLLIAILLPIAVFLYFQSKGSLHPGSSTPSPSQNNPGHASIAVSQTVENPQDTLLATVAGENIYLSTLRQSVGPQAGNKALENALNALIEKKVLDFEARKQNIIVSSSETYTKVLEVGFPSKSALSQDILDIVKYEVIKDKIMMQEGLSRETYVIGFWIAPYDTTEQFTSEQKAKQEQQRIEGKKALDDIKDGFRANEAMFAITKSVYDKYPVLQDILAVNGTIFKNIKEEEQALERPRIYVLNRQSMTKELYDALLSAKVGDIVRAIGDKGSGGSVAHVVRVNNGKYTSYNQWFSDKKKEIVVVHQSL